MRFTLCVLIWIYLSYNSPVEMTIFLNIIIFLSFIICLWQDIKEINRK